MPSYLLAAFLLIFVLGCIHSSELNREKRCATCCGPPPCCNCCGLPKCGFNFNLTDLINLTTESTVVTSTVSTPVSRVTRPPMCLTCCGKPPCCNTCGLDIKLN
ncbi:unnamed protein product [Adineta ricciae]|uniref:Uncharacterized protein n=1 Tax=Adineta ricciae TaxID=249248 RepID=A0A814VW65_ADIRI|nr:unnamed protein product [Adineta ricciae]CAF1558445.1 unnamed protein product [Adineta ricciae]